MFTVLTSFFPKLFKPPVPIPSSISVPTPTLWGVWLLLCTSLILGGWCLSALHSLNVTGYAFLLPCVAILLVAYSCLRGVRGFRFARLRWRILHLFPAGYLALLLLAFCGGSFYAPSNYDALAYRLPRLLHWLSESQWHWIHTNFHRLNVRAVGIEWISAPLLCLTHSDRFLFLINITSFLLMPSLVFSFFIRLGVSPRIAWQWMWLLPSGYVYITQAGSIGNDLFVTVITLLAFNFAIRAFQTNQWQETAFAILGGGVMTAAKSSSLPLLLPLSLLLVRPLWYFLRERPLAFLSFSLLSLSASFFPTAILNILYAGDWSGAGLENLELKTSGIPHIRFLWNALYCLVTNLTPPIFPFASSVNHWTNSRLPQDFLDQFRGYFEKDLLHFNLIEMQMEEYASLGLGLTLALIFGVCCSRSFLHRTSKRSVPFSLAILISVTSWFGLFLFFSRSGFTTSGRFASAYFPLLIPLFLLGDGFLKLSRRPRWHFLCFFIFLSSAILVFVLPARPLFPAPQFFASQFFSHSALPSALKDRLATVYEVYRQRPEAFLPLRPQIGQEKVVGLMAYDCPEATLWKPYGTIVVKHVLPSDSLQYLKNADISKIVACGSIFPQRFHSSFDEWLALFPSATAHRVSLSLRAENPDNSWNIVLLPDL